MIAGGPRRVEEEGYRRRLRELVGTLHIDPRVRITGYVPEVDLASIYDRAALVLAPFRATSGSGTLAQALGEGMPILASDLLLNREIAEREPGAIAFFRADDPEDCARRIDELLNDDAAREALSFAARRYAAAHTLQRMASLHLRFYRSILGLEETSAPAPPGIQG
jgi:glycosyltransferase involved in cell wall biosynthesis